jgi:hypothetical protein
LKQILYIVLSVFILAACSNKNSALLNRTYHNTTARYNGYYNSRIAIKESVQEYKLTQTVDYDTLLSIFLNASENASSLYPAMDKAIEKSTQVILDHSIEIRGEEFNKWVDENYLCVARAHFYKQDYDKAIEVLKYTTKKYPERKGIAYHYSWLVRSLLKSDNNREAGIYLAELNKLEELKRKERLCLEKTNADFFIAQENYEAAAIDVEDAIALEKKKKEVLRLKYLLAQLYNLSGDGDKAIPVLAEISKKSNNYNLAFAAVMMQAKSVENKVDGYAVKKRLLAMLKDEKNVDFLDQIYYALAEIEWTELNFQKGLDYLHASVENSVGNNKQKSKSYNRIADYHYGEKDYQSAKTYFDSTLAYIPSGKNKNNLEKLIKNLDLLVVELDLIDRNDSLISIYSLSEDEKNKKLKRVQDKIRRDLIKKAQDAKVLAAKQASQKGKTPKKKGSWYFYNDNTRSIGLKEFKKVWGDRPNVDNWRLKSKLEANGIEETNLANNPAGLPDVKVPSIAELSKDLPTSDQAVASLENQTMKALFQSGIVYKENFADFDNAIEAYENLLARYDTTSLKLNIYYQLYRLYKGKENQAGKEFFSFDSKSNSFYYEDLILNEYPNSEFAELIKNPNYLEEKAAAELADASIYDKLYRNYRNQNDSTNRAMLDSTLNTDLQGPVASKVLFLSARLAATMRDTTRLLADLGSIITNFSKEAVYPPALEMKKRLDDLLNIKPAPSSATLADTSASKSTEKSLFEEKVTGSQYYLIICPKSLKIDINSFKNELALFNDTYFKGTKLSVNHSFIDNNNQIILIKTFKDVEQSNKYYKAIEDQKRSSLKKIGNKKLAHFPITTKNFITLFKNKKVDAYKDFFKKAYNL